MAHNLAASYSSTPKCKQGLCSLSIALKTKAKATQVPKKYQSQSFLSFPQQKSKKVSKKNSKELQQLKENCYTCQGPKPRKQTIIHISRKIKNQVSDPLQLIPFFGKNKDKVTAHKLQKPSGDFFRSPLISCSDFAENEIIEQYQKLSNPILSEARKNIFQDDSLTLSQSKLQAPCLSLHAFKNQKTFQYKDYASKQSLSHKNKPNISLKAMKSNIQAQISQTILKRGQQQMKLLEIYKVLEENKYLKSQNQHLYEQTIKRKEQIKILFNEIKEMRKNVDTITSTSIESSLIFSRSTFFAFDESLKASCMLKDKRKKIAEDIYEKIKGIKQFKDYSSQ